jgi:predicted dehydrogenase
MRRTSRRTFLRHTATIVSAASLTTAAKLSQGAEETVTVGVIGPGGMGTGHLRLLLARKDVRVKYVCDPDAQRAAAAAKLVEQHGGSAAAVDDMRRVFDDKSVDAVWIATPDHWHVPAALLALDAGKHVYVEKPVSHNLREGQLLRQAAQRTGRKVQVGMQSRSSAHVREAVAAIQAGEIGEVLVAKAWNSQRRRSIGHAAPSEPPPHLNYDLWLGPAPYRPYQSNLLHGIWRWWYDFGTGDMGNDGVHDLDLARWGLGVTTQPTTITGLGSKFFFDDDQQFPDTQYCVFQWDGDGRVGHKRQLIFEQRIWSPYFQEGYENGNAFYGTKGVLILGKAGGWHIIGEKNAPGRKMSGTVDLPAHHQNFLDAIRNNAPLACDAEVGHLSASLAHLGNIACRVLRTLHFDPVRERMVGDDEADRLLRRTYRDGHWAVPRDA